MICIVISHCCMLHTTSTEPLGDVRNTVYKKRHIWDIYIKEQEPLVRTPLKEGVVAEKATGEEEEEGKGQSTQPETKEEVQNLANTQLIASSSSSCSAVPLFSTALTKNKEQRTVIFVKKEKKTSSQFNATNTGKYVSRKQIFQD